MDPFKRLDKMIEDLKSLQESLRKLEQNKKECRDLERPIKKRRLLKQLPLPSGKNDPMEVESAFLDSCDIASKHISGDLLKAWSKIRGYKLEADILVKQVARSRRVLTEESRKKQGDAASSGRPGKRHPDLKEVTRVYQAKTVSAAGNSSVNTAIKDAFSQLFGSSTEIPAKGAKLIAKVEIFSSKNYWPFTQTKYANVKNPVSKKQFAAEIKDALDSELAEVFANKIKSMPSARSDKDGIDKARKEKFVEGITTSEIKLDIHFKKQIVIAAVLGSKRGRDGNVANPPYPEDGKLHCRAKEGKVNSIALLYKVTGNADAMKLQPGKLLRIK